MQSKPSYVPPWISSGRLALTAVATGLMALAGPALAADSIEQGLTLTFSAGGTMDARTARLAALFVPGGEAATPFLPRGPFSAKWEGAILSPMRGQYTVAAVVAGKLKVSINGQELLTAASATTQCVTSDKIQLKKGANALAIEYQAPKAGDALFRLYWASKEFPAEPVPPTSFTHDPGAEALRQGAQLRAGRLLFAERRCAACHDGGGLLPERGSGMPELAQDAPVFAELGARFNEPWLAHWINDPASIRPHALMPRLFGAGGDEIDPRAADVAAYLASLGQRTDGKVSDDDVPLGGGLFANLGCIACHTTPEAEGEDEFHRVPLRHLKAKWQAVALREYLKDPQKLYAWSRMPNFRLSDEEAQRLTAFLLTGNQREFPAGPKGDPARGAQLAATSGCLNCHAGLPPTTAPKLADTLKAGWVRGCVADEAAARGAAPDFSFDPSEREALRALAASGLESLKQDVPAEFMERQVKALRCTACHSLDGGSSVWSQLDNEIAPLQAAAPVPEGEGKPIAGPNAPMFTWLGEKLRPEWAARFIAGGVSYKPRPWLIARMPGFGIRAEGVAQGLAFDHGFPVRETPEAAPETEKVEAGKTLLGENGGFNCTTCHGVGDHPPTAVFEAPGINLAYATERLRPEYYHRWVYFPLRIDPDTKMSKFADDDGKTPLTDFFGGDAHAQFEAIRQYLRTVTPAH